MPPDILALAASAAWFAPNIVLRVVVAMGAIYFTGFFGYLGYRERP